MPLHSLLKIALLVREELDIEINKEYFWTYSKVVLCYISNSSKRFKIFVANRIQFIPDHSDVAQWHYVPTAYNPTDYSSRSEGNPEVKPAVTVSVITIKQDLLLQLEGRIPSWEKMELVAIILKLKTQLLQKIKCINTSIF